MLKNKHYISKETTHLAYTVKKLWHYGNLENSPTWQVPALVSS